jgi:hypothetical protein
LITQLLRSRALSIGVILLVGGCGVAALWIAFGALYVPLCHNTFSMYAADARCRNPVLWAYGGCGLAVVGLVLIVGEGLHHLRNRVRSGEGEKRRV